ncbi:MULTISPECIES: aminomethyl-transferring glycine dehydrogenase subunit GcvPA [unclassified Fusibacter]|uniref:aminomethyl-transferring glycine dehydrogenase subunit GcvPA n=1 Tax=unclassified Fusibacter TaxID=2624464 RepID=UPI0010104962|nr:MULTISPECIES: aminomethyl-transferring glycine dehydrogenase subunit GcvPA [unclassified Fusibacter]MCK8059637.1 aminomethyl-transferring glycine dehydrogenase subunit GcvPA [Fusibacter sp. A2]NPE21438.1 aminomethyl-transferring glycine dehydrogenase subunit GcvPA [Fusibacter sp. A1]RXV61850.1 aminomethyl-transferring glycine dehydrogenase subunit GcvPA [Fusibacter sp. A1]
MFPYIPNGAKEEQKMLDLMGVSGVDALFRDIPDNVKLNRRLDLDAPKSELEVTRLMGGLAKQNDTVDNKICFMGAGAYDHYIPSIIDHITSRSEFYTSYTPYQPEISQGTLRAIFEYQTMISNLTGLQIANASLYDVQTAVVEAALMAISSVRKSNTILISKGVHPESRMVLKTYFKNRDLNVVEIDLVDGRTSVEDLSAKLGAEVGGVIIQSPNFLGAIEDAKSLEAATRATKAKFIMSVDPISLGALKRPSEFNADIAIGEGQSLGNYLNYGGPYLGFIAAKEDLARKMPGRICGQSVDQDGKRAFVLTLQAREQHIRRFKATSNICSNQGLLAVRATIYLSTLGKKGLKEVANQCLSKAHYAFDSLLASGKVKKAFEQPFFKEFVITIEKPVHEVNKKLLEMGILGGYDLSCEYPELGNAMLIAVTEKRTKEEIDALVHALEVIL